MLLSSQVKLINGYQLAIQCEQNYYVSFICWKIEVNIYFLRISLLTLLNTLFTTSKTYLLLELLSISPQIWNLCSLHKFKSLLCNDCCNFAPSSFYEVNHFKFCNPHSWLTSYLSFGARYYKSLHNKNSKYLEEHCCQVTRF